ncbi:MAG: DNA polymerase III subunit gamma/tau, partial [Paludibacter sp.]
KKNGPESPATFQRPGSISISAPNVVASPQATYSDKNETVEIVQNEPFTVDKLERSWLQYAETIPKLGRMASLILNNKPHQLSETEFEVTVSNSLQEKELKQLLPEILSYIHSQLRNSQINITIKMAEETEKQRANTPEERFRIMAEQNPSLLTLRNGLNLEID